MIGGSFSSSNSLKEKLKQLAVGTSDISLDQIVDSTLKIHELAIKSIQAHQSSGRLYKKGNVEHRASQPGFPPNSDSGTLSRSIAFNIDKEKIEGQVGSNLFYAKIMELGSRMIEARPFLLPALRAVAPEFVRLNKERLLKFYKSFKLK